MSEKIEKEPTITDYYGIDEDKVNDVSGEEKSIIQASLQKKLENVTHDYHMHLRGRILELIDPKQWNDFGLIEAPEEKINPKFDTVFYHKDAKKYEVRYGKAVMGFVSPELGGHFPQKYETRMAYEKQLKRDLQAISNLNTIAKKYNIILKAVRE